MNESVRGQILQTAYKATCGDRNNSYGPPTFQLSSSMRIKRLLRSIESEANLVSPEKRHLSGAEWEALETAAMKISRILCGPVVTADNYIDAAAYIAIAGEAADSHLETEVEGTEKSWYPCNPTEVVEA